MNVISGSVQSAVTLMLTQKKKLFLSVRVAAVIIKSPQNNYSSSLTKEIYNDIIQKNAAKNY